MHEKMQNRMKIAFCIKPPLPSILLAYKGAPGEFFFGREASVGLAPALVTIVLNVTIYVYNSSHFDKLLNWNLIITT